MSPNIPGNVCVKEMWMWNQSKILSCCFCVWQGESKIPLRSPSGVKGGKGLCGLVCVECLQMIVLMVVLLMYFSLMGSMVLVLTRVRSILGNGYEGSVSPDFIFLFLMFIKGMGGQPEFKIFLRNPRGGKIILRSSVSSSAWECA